MTLEIIAAFIGVYAALQALSLFLANLEVAAKQIEGRATWTAPNGTVFEEFSVSELEDSRIMQKDFEVSQAEAVMAHHFSGVNANA
jgi:hypothetical protein